MYLGEYNCSQIREKQINWKLIGYFGIDTEPSPMRNSKGDFNYQYPLINLMC